LDPSLLHELQHPNVPFTASRWSEEQTLHVACAYSNPIRWRTRRQLMQDFRRHMQASPNVVLHVGELAYGDRPFEVTLPSHPLDYQWRTRHELWHKENLLNLIIQRFPPDWRYGAYIDGDFHFSRFDWALEAIHQLQHFDWVQLFSTYTDLGYGHLPSRTTVSFARRFAEGELTTEVLRRGRLGGYGYGTRNIVATGGAWAFRREAFEACGGLLDCCILGSGDWHMAFGLAGLPDQHPQTHELTRCGRAYAAAITEWQNRASRVIRQNIGCVDTHAIHHYHGDKGNRGYAWRWQILRDQNFDPHADIFRDGQGVWQLSPERPTLRDAIRRYFRSRDEDR